MEKCVFTSNTAKKSGVFYLSDSSWVKMTDNQFNDNMASEISSGIIATESTLLSISKCDF